MVATTDLLVENRTSVATGLRPRTLHKAAAQNLADVAAMGAAPTALLVGLGAPPISRPTGCSGWPMGWRNASCWARRSWVATQVRSELIVVSVTALGDLGVDAPVTRAGARPGDAGGVWTAGLKRVAWGSAWGSTAWSCGGHRRPTCVPCRRRAGGGELGATSMVDVSDGLLADLGHVAVASGVGTDLDLAAFEVPGPDPRRLRLRSTQSRWTDPSVARTTRSPRRSRSIRPFPNGGSSAVSGVAKASPSTGRSDRGGAGGACPLRGRTGSLFAVNVPLTQA